MNYQGNNVELTAADIHALLGVDDPLILEIGANNGSSTLEFLEAMPKALIHSFEPDPDCIRSFLKKVGDSPSITLHQCAIGNFDGEIFFNRASNYASGSLREPVEHLKLFPDVLFSEKISVPIRKLDTFAEDYSITAIDFIWADVQGAEEDLIKGGLATLRKTKYFYTEFSDRELYRGQIDLNRILELLPLFYIFRLYNGNVLLKNTCFE